MKKSHVKTTVICLVIVTVLLISASCNLFEDGSEQGDDDNGNQSGAAGEHGAETEPRTNILLLGIDAGGTVHRSDTIMLLSLGEEDDDIVLVSIPRDSRVEIPGRGLDKINHAFAFGGHELTIETIENFLDLSIDYYAQVNFVAFEELVDLVGGVELEVEPAMVREHPHILKETGLQHLDGAQALTYVRFRKDSQGDIGRIQRQQKFLSAMAAQAVSLSTIPNIPKILASLNRNLETDIPITKIVGLANRLRKIDPSALRTGYIPGENAKIDGLWYWEVDNPALEELLVELGIKPE